jgi:hypothetical protein
LEQLLGALLDKSNEWNGWFDDLEPADDILSSPVTVVSAVEVSVRGRAIWGESGGDRNFWIEPFFASIRISEAADRILSYDLELGDACRGLAKFPYGKHVRYENWFFPADWLFTFSRTAA